MIKAKVSTDYKDIERIFAGGIIQKEIIKVWSTEAGTYVFEAWKILEMEGPLPLTFKANGEPLIDYRIYGNTVRNGTPTPENSIMPIGCGEKTENLAFTSWAKDFVRRVASDTVHITQVDGRTCLLAWASAGYGEYDTKYMFKTDFKELTVYTLSFEYMRPSNFSTASTIQVQYTDGTEVQLPSYINDGKWHKYTYVTASGKTVKSVCCYYSSWYVYIDVNTFMVVEGSTPPITYIPYGYKLPILSNSAVTDIYIGDTPLVKDEYVDSNTGKIYHIVDGALTPTDPPVTLPEIPTHKGISVIDYDGGEKYFLTSDEYELVDKNQNSFLLSGSTDSARPEKMHIKYKVR